MESDTNGSLNTAMVERNNQNGEGGFFSHSDDTDMPLCSPSSPSSPHSFFKSPDTSPPTYSRESEHRHNTCANPSTYYPPSSPFPNNNSPITTKLLVENSLAHDDHMEVDSMDYSSVNGDAEKKRATVTVDRQDVTQNGLSNYGGRPPLNLLDDGALTTCDHLNGNSLLENTSPTGSATNSFILYNGTSSPTSSPATTDTNSMSTSLCPTDDSFSPSSPVDHSSFSPTCTSQSLVNNHSLTNSPVSSPYNGIVPAAPAFPSTLPPPNSVANRPVVMSSPGSPYATTPQGTPLRQLKRGTPPSSATNSLNRRPKRRAEDLSRRSWGPSEKEDASRRQWEPASEKDDSFRRSWGPSEKEDGDVEFWASIQEPYHYIMSSALLPTNTSSDSLNQQNLRLCQGPVAAFNFTPTALPAKAGATPPLVCQSVQPGGLATAGGINLSTTTTNLTNTATTNPPSQTSSTTITNPFPIFTPQYPPIRPTGFLSSTIAPSNSLSRFFSTTAAGATDTIVEGSLPTQYQLELSWDPGDIMTSLCDYQQLTVDEFLCEYSKLYQWMIDLQLRWFAQSPMDANTRRVNHAELQRHAYTREIFLEQGNRLMQQLAGDKQAGSGGGQQTVGTLEAGKTCKMTDFEHTANQKSISVVSCGLNNAEVTDVAGEAARDITCLENGTVPLRKEEDGGLPCAKRIAGEIPDYQSRETDRLSLELPLEDNNFNSLESGASQAIVTEALGSGSDAADPALLRLKLQYLENKWQQLEESVAPPSANGRQQPLRLLTLDLAQEETALVSWLESVEGQLPELTFALPRPNSVKKLGDRLRQNQVLLQDIKTHGPFVKSLVKQFEYQASAVTTASSDAVSTAKNLSTVSVAQDLTTASNYIGTNVAETQQITNATTDTHPNKTAFTASNTNSAHHLLTDPALLIDLAESSTNARPNPLHLLAETPSPRDEALGTPRDSVETVTPRGTATESHSAYSTAASTPRDPSLISAPHLQTSSSRKSVGGSTSKQRPSKGPKSGVPKKARDLEKRYHLVFLKALEWQYYLEQLIADYKDHSSSGSDVEEPLSKCRRLSASSAESVYSSSSSLRPQSSTAVSRSASELGSSRESSPVRETESPYSQVDSGSLPTARSSRQNRNGSDDVDGATSVVDPNTNLVDAPRGRPVGVTRVATAADKSRRPFERHCESPKSIRRRAESVASKRKPRRKKIRLTTAAADDVLRSDNDDEHDQLRSTIWKGCADYELNISETGSYIESPHSLFRPKLAQKQEDKDDYVCVSDRGTRTRLECDSVATRERHISPPQQDDRTVQQELPEASSPDATVDSAPLTDHLQINAASIPLEEGGRTDDGNFEVLKEVRVVAVVCQTRTVQACSGEVNGEEQRKESPVAESDLNSETNPTTDVDMTVLPKSKTTTTITSNMEEENHVNGNVINEGAQLAEGENKSSPHQGSPNRAIFEFKHQDTDVEESPQLRRKGVVDLAETRFNTISEKDDSIVGSSDNISLRTKTSNINLNLSGYRRNGGRRSWPQQDPYDDSDSEALQKLIDSAILDPNWLQGGSDGLDIGSQEEGGSDEPPALETMDTGSEEGILQSVRTPVAPAKFDSSIHQLVNAAEHLVQATPLPSPIVSPRIPLSFNLTPRSQASPRTLPPLHFGLPSESANKQQRIHCWLATQRPAPALLDSCDASGEMTTGESDGESSDSADFTQNTHIARDLPQSVVSTPVADRTGCAMPFGSEPSKAVARSRRRRAEERRRPWSVAEHLARLSSLPASAPSQSLMEPARSGASAQPGASPRSHLSTSDPALRVQPKTSGLPDSSPADGQLSSSHTDLAESIDVLDDRKLGGGSRSTSFGLRGCASDSALDGTITQRLCSNGPGAPRFDHQHCTATSNASTAQGTAPLHNHGGLLSPCHSTSQATTNSGGASTLASTPAGGAPAIPEHPHLGTSPSGSGVQRRRKHKLRRRSNISLHTRGSDSGSDRLAGVSGSACPGHHLSLSASSDGGAAARHRLGGIVKSSSFAGHPLCTPALPVSPTNTLSAALSTDHSPCSAGIGPCNHSLGVASSVTSHEGLLQFSDPLASADGSPLNTPTPRMSCASARSNSILQRSSALNLPGRPLSYSVPLTVLSSSSDNSDKSHAGSPIKETCLGGESRVAALALSSARIAGSDVEAVINQEDFSSHSEQAWDPFLENKYLSENYSEDLDSEAAKKFLEFGDDYRKYIDSDGGSSFFGIPKLRGIERRGGYDPTGSVSDRSLPSSRLTGVSDFNETHAGSSRVYEALKNIERNASGDPSKSESNLATKASSDDQVSDSNNKSSLSSDHGRSQNSSVIDKKSTCELGTRTVEKAVAGTCLRSARKHRAAAGLTRGGLDVDSDSDMEDLMVMIEESKSQLVVAESVLNKHSGEAAAAFLMDYSEILSLCLTNLSGLQDILQHGPSTIGANRAIVAGE